VDVRAPAQLRERAPRVESTPQGDFWIVDSQVSGAIGLDASAATSGGVPAAA